MKYVVLLGDGMADYSIEQLGGKTPLEVAEKPNMDGLAKRGVGGYLKTIPEDMGAGSDVANLSILGYDPKRYYTGRGPLEAASLDIELKPREMAFRCNLITEKDGRIEDYSAGHISTEEAEELIRELNRQLNLGTFYRGLSYRNILVTDSVEGIITTPPHDVLGSHILDNLPRPADDPGVALLRGMILKSSSILADHPVNRSRRSSGKNPANMIWLWGEGVTPSFESFEKKYGIKGAIISAVDLLKGIGKSAGMEIIEVPRATGNIDTNWEGKADSAIRALETFDFVYLHVEAVDEASHHGDVDQKIRAIEEFDKRLIGRLLDSLDFKCRIALLPDHYTPISLRTHSKDPVPYIVSEQGGKADGMQSYSEKEVRSRGSLGLRRGHEFMKFFLR